MVLSTRDNLSSGDAMRRSSNPHTQLHRLGKLLYNLQEASVDVMICKERVTKELTNLRMCAGWSAPLYFAYNRIKVCRDEAINVTSKLLMPWSDYEASKWVLWRNGQDKAHLLIETSF